MGRTGPRESTRSPNEHRCYDQGEDYDWLEVLGMANLDDALEISLINYFDPMVDDRFELLTYLAYSKPFATLDGLDIGNGKEFDPTYGGQG